MALFAREPAILPASSPEPVNGGGTLLSHAKQQSAADFFNFWNKVQPFYEVRIVVSWLEVCSQCTNKRHGLRKARGQELCTSTMNISPVANSTAS